MLHLHSPFVCCRFALFSCACHSAYTLVDNWLDFGQWPFIYLTTLIFRSEHKIFKQRMFVMAREIGSRLDIGQTMKRLVTKEMNRKWVPSTHESSKHSSIDGVIGPDHSFVIVCIQRINYLLSLLFFSFYSVRTLRDCFQWMNGSDQWAHTTRSIWKWMIHIRPGGCVCV